METLSSSLQPFSEWLLRTTLQASLLICLILVIQLALGTKLGVRWRYCLWLVLLLRMALPWAPQSRLSISNLIPQRRQPVPVEYARRAVADDSAGSGSPGVGVGESTPPSATKVTKETAGAPISSPDVRKEADRRLKARSFEVADVLPLVWLAGALALAIYVCAGNFSLWRIVKRERLLIDQWILELLEDCKSQMRVRTIVGLVVTDKVRTPALFGFVRPRLLLPRSFIEALDREELRHVFLHELAHLRRHDIFVGYLVSILQTLHWFNPLVWLAFHRLRADRELACDGLALSTMQTDESPKYGRTIVHLLENFLRPRRLPSLAGISEDKTQIKRRITMIARFKKKSYRWSPLAVILIIILGCVSLPDAERKKGIVTSAAKPEPTMTLRKLAKGWGGFASLSPDGRYMCDVDWDVEETERLVLRELATGRERSLTNTGHPEHSAISRASTQVAYLWYDRNWEMSSLCTIGLDGSGRRFLRRDDCLIPMDWSADDKEILAIQFNKDPKQLVWVSAVDGSIRQIKSMGKGDFGKFEISPDGRFVIYDRPQSDDSSERDIFVFDLREDREIALIEHPANDRLLGWTPDGKSIFFASDRTGTWDGWLQRVADGELQGFPQLVRQSIGDVTPIGFAQGGSFYYQTGGKPMRDVFIATLDLDRGEVLASPMPVRQTGTSNFPDWSPDGRELAYCTRRPEGSRIIHIRDLATGEEREIDTELPVFVFPHWSADGRSILGATGREPPHSICKIDVQTGERTDLVRSTTGRLWECELFPDGKTLLYVRDDPNSKTTRFVVRNLTTGREEDLIRAMRPVRLRDFALSPDKQRLVYITSVGSSVTSQALKIVPAAGGEPRELLQFDESEKMWLMSVAWMPDSQDVLFAKWLMGGKGGELWRISAQGGEPRKVWAWKEPFTGLCVHPDGQRIAFHTRTAMSEMWVMENFLPVGGGQR